MHVLREQNVLVDCSVRVPKTCGIGVVSGLQTPILMHLGNACSSFCASYRWPSILMTSADMTTLAHLRAHRVQGPRRRPRPRRSTLLPNWQAKDRLQADEGDSSARDLPWAKLPLMLRLVREHFAAPSWMALVRKDALWVWRCASFEPAIAADLGARSRPGFW